MRPDESFVAQPVRSLQTMLRAISELEEEFPYIVPDGIYGKQTHGAVSYFQRTRGLPVTGATDQVTWERIAEDYERALVELSPAQPLQIFLDPGEVIRSGDRGNNVLLVQLILTALADVYCSMVAPDMTGILDAQTQESILSFQYMSALPQTGEVDKITWQHLALQYPLAVNHKESENVTRR